MTRFTKTLALGAVFLLPAVSSAAVLVKMNSAKTRAVFSGPELEFARVGDRIKITEMCEFVIDRKSNESDTRVGVQTSTCIKTGSMKVGVAAALVSVSDGNQDLVSPASSSMTADGYRVIPMPKEQMISGFGVGFVLGNMQKEGIAQMTQRDSFGNNFETQKFAADENVGAAFGGVNLNYSYMPRSRFGVSADLTLASTKVGLSDDDYYYVRPALNLTLGFLDNYYISGGMNYMNFMDHPKFIGGEYDGEVLKLKPSVGLQVGGGMTFWDNWQAHIQYTQSTQKIDQDLSLNEDSQYYSPNLWDYDNQTRAEAEYTFTGVEFMLQFRF